MIGTTQNTELPTLDLSQKKKRRKHTERNPEGITEDVENLTLEEQPIASKPALEYSYEELAGRIYSLLHSSNPNFTSKQNRLVIPPPMLCRMGRRVTWSNFAQICKIIKRKEEHFMTFVLIELGAEGSLDGSHNLVVKGKFLPKHFENVIRSYVREYVACRTCMNANTSLKKENRIYMLQCHTCGSTRSVSTLKKGFEAQVGRRRV